MRFINSKFYLLLLGALCLLVSGYLQYKKEKGVAAAEQIERFGKLLNQRIADIDKAYKNDNDLACKSFSDYAGFPDKTETLFQREGVAFFVYNNSKLLFWSDNAVPVD